MSLRTLLAAAALCLGVAFVPAAHAKKGIGVINTGDELFEVADFPADLVAADDRLKQMKVGYKCDHFGVFWADVWTWNCGIVGLKSGEDNSYYTLPGDMTSQLSSNPDYAIGKAKRGLWNHYGFWAALVLIIGFAVVGKVSGSRSETAAA